MNLTTPYHKECHLKNIHAQRKELFDLTNQHRLTNDPLKAILINKKIDILMSFIKLHDNRLELISTECFDKYNRRLNQ